MMRWRDRCNLAALGLLSRHAHKGTFTSEWHLAYYMSTCMLFRDVAFGGVMSKTKNKQQFKFAAELLFTLLLSLPQSPHFHTCRHGSCTSSGARGGAKLALPARCGTPSDIAEECYTPSSQAAHNALPCPTARCRGASRSPSTSPQSTLLRSLPSSPSGLTIPHTLRMLPCVCCK